LVLKKPRGEKSFVCKFVDDREKLHPAEGRLRREGEREKARLTTFSTWRAGVGVR